MLRERVGQVYAAATATRSRLNSASGVTGHDRWCPD